MVVCLLLSISIYLLKPKHHKIWVLIFIDAAIFIAGFLWDSTSSRKPEPPLNQRYLQALVRLREAGVTKTKYIKYEAEIIALNNDSLSFFCGKKLLVYFQHSAKTSQLTAGNFVQVYGKLTFPKEPVNPDEFNYKSYLQHKHLVAVMRIDSTAFKNDNSIESSFSLWYAALKLKIKLLGKLKYSGLSDDAYAICAALISGFDDEIDRRVMKGFANSGTLHVLSVSGLHTGLLYVILAWLLSKLDPHQRHRFLQWVLITLSMWLFAFFTGLAAPIVRAVLMFSFMGIGRLYFRSSSRNQLNILAFSAYLMLLYDVHLLFDAGFLLSYSAMFGLLYLSPLFARHYADANAGSKMFLNSFNASVSATLSTLPFSLYLFKQFPIWFALSNLLVVPLSFILLFGGLAVGLGAVFLVEPVNLLTSYLLRFIGLFNNESIAVINHINFSGIDAVFMTLVLFLTLWAVAARSANTLLASLLALVVWQLGSLYNIQQLYKREEITLYSTPRITTIGVKSGNKVLFNAIDTNAYDYSIAPHLIALQDPDTFCRKFNEVSCFGRRISILQKSVMPSDSVLATSEVLVAGERGTVNEAIVKNAKKLKWIIATNRLYEKERKRLSDLSRKFGIGFFDMAENGACIIKPGTQGYEIENWR